MLIERKKYEVKNSVPITKNEEKKDTSKKNDNSKAQKTDKVNNSGAADNNIERKKERLCPVCGELLDEQHKSNLITEEEFIKRKEELKKDGSSKLREELKKEPKNLEIENYIKEAMITEFEISNEEQYSNFNAAHHLISINDIFFKEEILARMAISCDYNINGLENGIYLPALLREKNSQKEIIKENVHYRIMECTGMQLHNLAHSYKISKDLEEKYKLKNYSTLVRNDVKDYFKEIELKCWLSEQEKKNIIDGLNKISMTIRNKLNMFKTEPKKCKYYVSEKAIRYAFSELEEEIKIIELKTSLKNRENIKVVKYILKADKTKGRISFTKENEYAGALDVKFLKFCEDIIFFIFENTLFLLEEKLEFNNYNILDKESKIEDIKSNKNKMFQLLDKISEKNRNKKYTIRELILLRKNSL